MLTTLQSVILGTVEGLTEFVPISSSGHLILARQLLHINTDSGLAFDAVLQLGTILAAFVYFRKDVWNLIVTAWKLITGKWKSVPATDRTLFVGIIVGSIPAVILGLLLKHTMETIFRNVGLVAAMFIAGSLLFIAAERAAKQTKQHPDVKTAWWIGVFQTLALVPGVSRSGATISGGLFQGLTREAATRFSFLLSLPIIAGSGLLELADVVRHGGSDFTLTQLAIGLVTSFVFGFISIRWLIGYLKKHSLMIFVWYRCLLALAIFAVLALTHA